MNVLPSFMFNAEEFLTRWKFCIMSNVEIGKMITRIFEELEKGNYEYLRQFSFIGRIYKGWNGRPSIPLDIRRKVLSVGRCEYCKTKENLTVDHIKPVSKGGSDNIENLQCLCWLCNRKKGPNKSEMV